MIKFIDLETGNVFNGQIPYIFWVDGEQSTNIIYSKPICFICDKSTSTINLSENPIFKLVDSNKLSISKKQYDFKSITKDSITIKGQKYNDKYYIYIIYILATSQIAGEFIENFEINKEKYCIGADFYDLNESLLINLSNNGVEIPGSIQKTFYETNLVECKSDNVILNRKWKELLSNYWDIIANKGSYKSLLNSLSWFEYPDDLKLYEIWGSSLDSSKYHIKEIQNILQDKYRDTLNMFHKTTYLSLQYALEKINRDENNQIVYDDELNPLLQKVTSKWATQDLSLKLSLLGYFYEKYFMPIHLNLVQSTIVDIVYTNNFKQIINNILNRYDIYHSSLDFTCNIKNNNTFKLTTCKCFVGPNTLFKTKINSNNTRIIGVQKEEVIDKLNNSNLGNYLFQFYNDIGSIIDFEIILPSIHGDFIKRELLEISRNSESYKCMDYKLFDSVKSQNNNYTIPIKFSLLFTQEGDYDITLQFDSAGGKTYIKTIHIHVIDNEYNDLKLYKITPLASENISIWNVNHSEINDYVFTRQSNLKLNDTPEGKNYTQYLTLDDKNKNHILILKNDVQNNQYLEDNYFIFKRQINEQNTYTICISKEIGHIPAINELKKLDIYKNSYAFIPGFYTLEEFGEGNILQNYTIAQNELLCVKPRLSYGKHIVKHEWEFINTSVIPHKTIKLDRSINSPFIAPINPEKLDPGYYDVIFRYKLDNDNVNEIRLDSAFLIKK